MKPCIPQWPFPSQPFGFDPERRLANMLTLIGLEAQCVGKGHEDVIYSRQLMILHLYNRFGGST